MNIKYELHASADPTVTRIIPELAVEIGLNESIVLLQVAHWIKVGNHEVDGEFWTFQSVREMHDKAFAYWSVDTVARTANNLLKSGYLKSRIDLNQRKNDKTRWFALNVEKLRDLKSITIVQVQEKKSAKAVRSDAVRKSDTTPQDQTTSPQNRTGQPQNQTTLPEITRDNTEIKEKEIAPSDPEQRQKQAAEMLENAFGGKPLAPVGHTFTDAELAEQLQIALTKHNSKQKVVQT